MARKPRLEQSEGTYHVYARGNAKESIFRDDADGRRYLELLASATRENSWNCLSYCLMGNHVHLLLETCGPNLGTGMGSLHSAYARTFNARYERIGHVFQGRFGSNRIKNDVHLLTTAAYIARNPVEAGLCADPAEWRWSSFSDTINRAHHPWLNRDRLLALFGGDTTDARQRFARFVAESATSR